MHSDWDPKLSECSEECADVESGSQPGQRQVRNIGSLLRFEGGVDSSLLTNGREVIEELRSRFPDPPGPGPGAFSGSARRNSSTLEATARFTAGSGS